MLVKWINYVYESSFRLCNFEGFKECGYIRFDGYIVSLHSSLNDETMVKGEGPPEVRTKVKEFLIQLEKESDDIRCHLDNSV